jgi:hypothetical protein
VTGRRRWRGGGWQEEGGPPQQQKNWGSRPPLIAIARLVRRTFLGPRTILNRCWRKRRGERKRGEKERGDQRPRGRSGFAEGGEGREQGAAAAAGWHPLLPSLIPPNTNTKPRFSVAHCSLHVVVVIVNERWVGGERAGRVQPGGVWRRWRRAARHAVWFVSKGWVGAPRALLLAARKPRLARKKE